ncbi:TetR/AcrR family transcriptional regulator [Zavarzinia sp. CC-PAN008]|uniref:TetR/AcrR family transcriptional regulator n=1 Tax=Zavarzinia sp. CC-PAN008 TaxID=3243332 RepID=UPI003F74711F
MTVPPAAQRLPSPADNLETREAILEAAARVFLEKGFQAASLNEIAEAAGFTKGAVYSNFSGKDDLFLEVWHSRILTRLASAAAVGGQIQDPRGRLQALADGIQRDVTRDNSWTLLIIEFLIHAARRPALQRRVAEVRAEQRRQLAALLDGILPADASAEERRQSASVLAALSNGMALERLTEDEILTVPLLRRSLDRLFPPAQG